MSSCQTKTTTVNSGSRASTGVGSVLPLALSTANTMTPSNSMASPPTIVGSQLLAEKERAKARL